MKQSKWQDDAEYWTRDDSPAELDIAIALIVMVIAMTIAIAILVVSAWSLS